MVIHCWNAYKSGEPTPGQNTFLAAYVCDARALLQPLQSGRPEEVPGSQSQGPRIAVCKWILQITKVCQVTVAAHQVMNDVHLQTPRATPNLISTKVQRNLQGL